jgi:threonine-phosphate decarboxylase
LIRFQKNILNTPCQKLDWDGEDRLASEVMSACAHGGIYSVDHQKVSLDFSSSVNPLGAPDRALRAVVKCARDLASKYPDPECRELRQSLGGYLELDEDCIVVGNGAVEIIYWFAQAFSGKNVLIPSPTFCEYELVSRRAGSSVKIATMTDFALDSDSIITAAAGADALYLCNPNNPTGKLATGEIRKVLDGIDKKTMILLDECFIELVDDSGKNSFVPSLKHYQNLVILRSLTKSFALAGLRVGYACASPSIIEKLKRHRIPWNVNALAQAAGVAALSDRKHVSKSKKVIAREREFMITRLSKLRSFSPVESDANYFMVKLHGRDSTAFRDELLEKTGILVRDCSTFNGMDRHHVRVAVKTRRENLRLIKALEAFDSG